MIDEASLLKEITHFLRNEVKPHANTIDHKTEEMKKLLFAFRDHGFFRIYVPCEFGGVMMSRASKIQFEIEAGRCSGAFSFLQAQTATASWIVKNSPKTELKEKYLSEIAAGKIMVGNSVSHLNPKKQGILKGERNNNGYTITGKIHFASGWNLFDRILIGFHTENNEEVFALIPFNEVQVNSNFTVSEALDVISMLSLNTVSLCFDDYFIHDTDIVCVWEKGTFFDAYKKFPVYGYPLGAAIEALALIKDKNYFAQNKTHFENKLSFLKQEMQNETQSVSPIKLFAELIYVSSVCVQYAILHSGGFGLLKQSSLQRLYREIPILHIPRAYPETIEQWVNLI